MTIWVTVGALALITAVFKGIGPFVLGGRDLPERFNSVVGLLAPALLAGLVLTATFAQGTQWQVGAVTVGVAVGGIAAWRGASAIVSVIVAMTCTALLRAAGMA